MTDQIQVPAPIGDNIDAVMASVEERKGIFRRTGSSLLGITTGLDELDDLTLGLQGGDLIFLAARPSMGKTTLAMNIADAQGTEGHSILFASLEMQRKTLLLKLFAIKSGVSMRDLQIGKAEDNQYEKVQDVAEDIRRLPLYVGDDIYKLNEMCAIARKMKASEEYSLDGIIFDYLQLAEFERGGYSREGDVALASRTLKLLAKELDIPILALCQLNREVEKRDPPRPMLSDLRESGAIEQDADVVLFLNRHKPRLDRIERDGKGRLPTHVIEALAEAGMTEAQALAKCDIIVAKQRNGPTGTVPTWFDDSTQRFRNWDHFVPYPSTRINA